MDKKNYTVYHLHSDLSNGITNIDSITKYNEYIEYANSIGMKSIGFGEHGNIFQWVKKKVSIEKLGMKYIHAEEFYITEDLYQQPKTEEYEKELTELTESLLGTDSETAQKEIQEFYESNKIKVRDNYHCILIAKNYEGVKELNQLSSIAFNKDDGHFYYVPRITLEELFNTSSNIIITTACLGGVLCKGNEIVQEKMLKFLIKNNDRCYLEIQHHFDVVQIKYNQYLSSISKKYNIPLIAGTDTHALNKEHLSGREILQKSKDVIFENESKFDLTFKTYDELVECYRQQGSLPESEYLEAIENTNRMADRIETFDLDYSKKYPKLYDDSLGVFKQKIVNGLKEKAIDKSPKLKEYMDKIKYEIETYVHNDAIDFMLLEEDYKNALRKKGVYCGYSRGSVSGSVIAYLLNITDVDSIKFNLNFERFMNTERISLADVDSDWYKGDRWKVREYLYNKKGLHCCDIITFNTIAMKGAIKDVGRALGMTPEETQQISDAVEEVSAGKFTISDSYREKYQLLFKYVDIVQGTIVSVGNHPAGLVVSPHDVNTAFGTFYSSANENPISQINMKEVDMLNYVKLDVLGLDCVGLINQTCEFANIPRLTPDNMNFNDLDVWKDVADDCTMIFQFESDFASSYLKDILKEETINNIKSRNPNFSYIDLMSMANGAIRPAGASYREELSMGIYRDNGHQALNDFLAPTLGYLIYQEQIIEFLHIFCGFTMGEADIVRRAFSKKTGTDKHIPVIKNGGYLEDEHGHKSNHYIKGFVDTMYDNYGVENEEAENLIINFLQVIIDASDYLFSKNHADPYSFLGYACAYLRHYYLLEFLTSGMNIYKEDSDKSGKIKEYAKKKGIEILPIKFGKSRDDYFMDKENNSIYQGISSIKYCNSQIANELLALSQENTYDNFIDLLIDIKQKTSVDTRQLKILTTLNFFSDFGKNKKLLQVIEMYDNLGTKKQIKKTDIEKFNINFDIFRNCYDTETDKMYKGLDMTKYIKYIFDTIDDKQLSIKEQISSELMYLEYIVYNNPKAPRDMYFVMETKFYKDKTKPYLQLYNLKDGNTLKTKITEGKKFVENPFKANNVILVKEFKTKNKMKNINGVWTKTEELEQIVSLWEVY